MSGSVRHATLRSWFALTVWSFALLGPLSITSQARADSLRAELSWEKPVGTMCPPASVLRADVEQLMGRAVFAPANEADVTVRGVVEDLATGVRVRIVVRDSRGALLGNRELTAPAGECASLRRALGIVLALLLDQEVEPRDAVDTRRRSIVVGLSVGLLSATLPRLDVGFGVSLATDAATWLRLRADASYWLPVVAETQRGVGGSFQTLRGGLALCPRLVAVARLTLRLCGGAEVGALLAQPQNLAGPERQVRLLVQPALALAFALRVSRHVSLDTSLGGLLNALRPSFSYGRADGTEASVYRPALFGAVLHAGVTID